MDNAFHLDIGEIVKTVRQAEVVTFRFVTVPSRLLIDNRHNEVDGPMLKLVPKAASAEERFKSLKMLRPRFRLPEKISAIWWPRYVDSLVDHGIWEAIVERVAASGFTAAPEDARLLFAEIRAMERAELANAIGGEGYRTLWPVARR